MAHDNKLTIPITMTRRDAPRAPIPKLVWLIHLVGVGDLLSGELIRTTLKNGGTITFGPESAMVSIKGQVMYCAIAYDGDRCAQFDAQVHGYAIIGGLDVPGTLRVPQNVYTSGYVQMANGARIAL